VELHLAIIINLTRCIMGNFKKLRVWQKAKDLAVRIYKLTDQGQLRTQLSIAVEIGYLSVEKYNEIEAECDEISAMITRLIKHRMK